MSTHLCGTIFFCAQLHNHVRPDQRLCQPVDIVHWTTSRKEFLQCFRKCVASILERACNSPLPQMEISFIFGWTIIVYCKV